MKILLIPDVHGETFWAKCKNIADNYDKIIFLGDYLDSFFVNDKQMVTNFKDIIAFKKANPDKVILLFGNHEFSYYDKDRFKCSGYRASIYEELHNILIENINLFQVSFQAYAMVNDKKIPYIFTHAGINTAWYMQHGELIESQEGNNASEKINNLMNSEEGLKALNQVSICSGGSYYTASPLWMRPQEFKRDSALYGYRQIVGHTPQAAPYTITHQNKDGEEARLTIIDSHGSSDIVELQEEFVWE